MRATIVLMAAALLAAPSFAASPEAEAVGVFHEFCVLTNGQPDAIAGRMKPVVQAGAGGEMPAAELTARTGIRAEHAWGIREGSAHQMLLLTTEAGTCTLHLSSGDRDAVKEAFLPMIDHIAAAIHGRVRALAPKTPSADDSDYAIDVPGAPKEIRFGLRLADEPAPSGTQHRLLFSLVDAPKPKP